MKLLKRLIIVIFIITILIVAILIILAREENMKATPATDDENQFEQIDDTIEIVNDNSIYLSIKNCISKYNNALSKASLMDDISEKQEYITAVYDMLDNDYIDFANINTDNISEKIEFGSFDININEIYEKQKNENQSIYFVYGTYINLSSNIGDEYGFIIKVDRQLGAFSISLYDYMINRNYIKSELTNNINMDVKLEKNKYNIYTYQAADDTEMSTEYFLSYKKNALFNPTKAYETLDKTYRDARFGSLENYIEYLKNNGDYISKLFLDKYQKKIYDGYTQYVCIDTNGNYYIFKETATMQYTLLLDTYTIDIPEFIEKYENADDMTKIGMNIEKIKAALNSKDYQYVYNKFNSGFKNNYFKDVTEFENYVKNNWYDKIKITYNNFSTEGKTYIFEVYLSDETGKNSGVLTKNFNMQLKEGTDFIFSFDV